MPTPTKKRKNNKLKLGKLNTSSEIEDLNEHTDSTIESGEFLSEMLRQKGYSIFDADFEFCFVYFDICAWGRVSTSYN